MCVVVVCVFVCVLGVGGIPLYKQQFAKEK